MSFSGMAGPRGPAALTAPVLSGAPVFGTLTITPGTWSRTTTVLYTLLRGGVPVLGYIKVDKATIEARALVEADFGPALVVREHSLAGGNYADSAPAFTYSPAESVVVLPQAAAWISQQGVTVATGVSSWVRYLGGLSCTLTQGTGGLQPAYNASGGVGGRPLITFDGVDDVLKGVISAKGSVYSSCELGIVGQRVSFGAAGDSWIMYEETATAGFLYGIRDQSAALWRASESSYDLSATSDPDGVNAYYSFDATASGGNVRKSGTIEGTTAAAMSPATRTDAQTVSIGGRTASGGYANIAIQGAVFGVSMLATQRAYLRAALTFHTGINC